MSKKVRGLVVIGTVALAALAIGVGAAAAQGRGPGPANNDGYCSGDNFVDADGDGLCDLMGTGQSYGSGVGFVDADGDGVCDHFTDADGDGVCDNCATQTQSRSGSGRGWRR